MRPQLWPAPPEVRIDETAIGLWPANGLIRPRRRRLRLADIDKTKQPTTFNNTRLLLGLITRELPAVDPATWLGKGRSC